jgi:hypothetical protein
VGSMQGKSNTSQLYRGNPTFAEWCREKHYTISANLLAKHELQCKHELYEQWKTENDEYLRDLFIIFISILNKYKVKHRHIKYRTWCLFVYSNS